jgi:hypothetical protein
MDIEEAISEYLKNQPSFEWAEPSQIMEAIYPKFQTRYPEEDTFKRLFFRALRKTPKIMKNLHGSFYAYERSRKRFTKSEIEFMRRFFEVVDHPYRYVRLNLEGINQYPDIPLERTFAFKELRFILSRLWKDPEDIEIVRMTKKEKWKVSQ